MFVCLCVSLSVSSLPLVRSVQLLRNAEKRIANITKAYIRNNFQVELIRCRKQIAGTWKPNLMQNSCRSDKSALTVFRPLRLLLLQLQN